MQPRVHLIFAGLMLVMLLGAPDATILATALPTIVAELGGIERLGEPIATSSAVSPARWCPTLPRAAKWTCEPGPSGSS